MTEYQRSGRLEKGEQPAQAAPFFRTLPRGKEQKNRPHMLSVFIEPLGFNQSKNWCRGPESNRYGSHDPRDFKSLASASSATPAEINKMEAAPRIELGIKVLQTSALPLGYAAISWSGKRDSNPRPPPWQGDALPLSYFRLFCGASRQNRTVDTRIFSPLLYRLSYRGKNGDPDQI